ncbi:MAG: hypothetical protein IJZ35_09535 [Clostridia bacterium]|nr:hypothetical protein [Clostridia bacterium]
MPRFQSLISNGEYIVGCTGQTVYVYDKNNIELAKFKDLKYAYTPEFSPNGDIFIVKSTTGRLAVYSLKELSLLKKFRFSKVDCSQDDGFCFSPDGKEFYNIERHIDSCKTALSIYNTTDFSLKKRLFLKDTLTVLSDIEYDNETDTYYLIGFFRDKVTGVKSECFVSKLVNDKLTDILEVSWKEYVNCTEYKNLQRMGFSDMAREYFETNPDDKTFEENYTISTLYKINTNRNHSF